MSDPFQLQFLGAAETVTGSRTCLHFKGRKYLIDCGLFQGPKELRVRNWEPFSLAPQIDSVILTHAHIDHSGYIPRLVAEGFRGPIYSSAATEDLSRILLMDTAHLQEEDAQYLNRKGISRHKPALPLFTQVDVEAALRLFKPQPLHQWMEIGPGLNFRFFRAGHILGACMVQLALESHDAVTLLTFSGDLGNGRQYVIREPDIIKETDYLVLESTYGDRLQSRSDPLVALQEIIQRVHSRGGVLVIPAFTVGRTQELLYLLGRLEEERRIPQLPVYLDSPMAIGATDLYLRYKEDLKFKINGNCIESPFNPARYHTVKTTDQSMLLNMQDGPMIIISAAGMLSGGRILHHLRRRLPDQRNIVLFVGYQAEGTKGRLLQSGIPLIRIHKQQVTVDAEIVTMDSLSAHADTSDLVNWVKQFQRPPRKIILNHGELAALQALAYRLRTELGLEVQIAKHGEIIQGP